MLLGKISNFSADFLADRGVAIDATDGPCGSLVVQDSNSWHASYESVTLTTRLLRLHRFFTVGPILRYLERAKAVALFHLTTGHDFLGVYLHWLGVAANEANPICGHARMDGDHLLQCTGLDEYPADDIVSLYWEARHQMVEKPSTGVVDKKNR
ncbi:reverse transcriptase [Trichonephila clavipes]|nr:reverse transcriptase [Trichonephila clavipes]